MVYSGKEGFFRPEISKTDCIECGKCEKVCPALHQESDSLIGKYEALLLAHSTDECIRRFSTSGGVINTLVRYLINNGIVQAVLLCVQDDKSPVEAAPILIDADNVGELLNNPRKFASRYVSIPLLKDFRKAVSEYSSIAAVGTPCQIKAVELFEKSIKTNCKIFKIGVTCSGGISYRATAEYKRKMHFPEADIFYRGDGWPGKNTLVKGERSVEYKHTSSMFEKMFTSQIFKNPGCKGCKDHFAESADISFCDYWNRDEMTSETVGNSCVIVRSKEAKDIVDRMCVAQQIEIVKELAEDSVINTQLRPLKIKKGNVRSGWRYKLFGKACDFVFKSRIYKLFGARGYRLFCREYLKLCDDEKL
jgi:coenzyme F420-reducing hydrogenase beta subunit